MLPRKITLRMLCLSLATALGASSFLTPPSQAITGYNPPVTVQVIAPKLIVKANSVLVSSASVSSVPLKTVQVLAPTKTQPFSLVGLTWVGNLPVDTTFKVRVREAGKWSSWNVLYFSDDHGVDADSLEAAGTRMGTDPLMTAVADGIEVVFTNNSGLAPNDLEVNLIGSQETSQDRALISSSRMLVANGTLSQAAITPAGGMVLRPNIVTRAQWGANESWRDPVPKMGTKILAGFVHHTASTNNYSPAQGPAQMRALYAYYTKSKLYADLAYNFLVDQYGTVYEGRNGCVYKSTAPCDGPSLPAQGAHTAGLNINTFAISAIGNYDTKKPSHPDELVEAIASLMAWKIAPYGLDPNAITRIASLDTTGRSKFPKGQMAVTQVISGHRDVGRTVCPGRYLYPYLPAIRDRATELLTPVIHDIAINPAAVEVDSSEPITVSAVVPSSATWSISVVDATSGLVLKTVNSDVPEPLPSASSSPTVLPAPTPTSAPIPTPQKISYTWDRTDAADLQVSPGRYFVRISATYGTTKLPTTKSTVFIGRKALAVTAIKFKKKTKTKAYLSWVNPTGVLPITSQLYRYSKDGGKTWSSWKVTKSRTSGFTFKKLKLGARYVVQVKVKNVLGTSPISTYKFRHK